MLKLNGKTDIPRRPTARCRRCNATVEDAVRLGADAVGYTLYVGTPGAGARFRAVPPGPAPTLSGSACR